MYSYVEINRVFNNKLPQPYSDCISDQDIKKSDSQLVQLILSTGYDYKYVDCVNMCAEVDHIFLKFLLAQVMLIKRNM